MTAPRSSALRRALPVLLVGLGGCSSERSVAAMDAFGSHVLLCIFMLGLIWFSKAALEAVFDTERWRVIFVATVAITGGLLAWQAYTVSPPLSASGTPDCPASTPAVSQ